MMSTAIPESTRPVPTHPLLGAARAATAAFVRFATAPASPRPLAVLRIGLCAVLLAQALAIAGSLFALYGPLGLAQWHVSERMVVDGVPRVRWLARLLAPLGVDAPTALRLTFLAYVAGLAYLLLGWRTRVAAVVAWLTHVALNASGCATTYGVDQFADVALFYCVWMPVGEALSVDRRAGRATGAPSAAARVGLRVLQIHMCIAYLASGIEKGSGEQWWNGEAIWRALLWPDPGRIDFTWLADVPWLAVLICWSTLLVEAGYAVMVWPRPTRKAWVLATIGMHLGIAVFMQLVSFAAVMIVLNVAAFLVPTEPESKG
jgi:hypothetical protein